MNSLSKLVAEKVLGLSYQKLVGDGEKDIDLGWVNKEGNLVFHPSFSPAENWLDCMPVIEYLACQRKLDITIKYDDETKKHVVMLNYTNVSAEHTDLCKAICIAAVQSVVLERELTPTHTMVNDNEYH